MKKQNKTIQFKKNDEVININYKFKNIKKTTIITLIVDLFAAIFFDWWWFILTIIFTTFFSIKNYSNYDDAKEQVKFYINKNYVPVTEYDYLLLKNDFSYSDDMLKIIKNII